MGVLRVLILDSGAGGLSIASEVRKQLPQAQLVYLADLACFPYGLRNESFIIERVTRLIERVVRRFEIHIVVIACNTASTVVLDALRSRFSMPFVGVVPAIKPAARLTRTGAIGVLATHGTINRHYTKALIQDFAGSCKVVLHGSPVLVEAAERKLNLEPVDLTILKRELECLTKQLPNQRIDTVVLACTHFPLLRAEFRSAMPRIDYWVDSGEAIGRRVLYWKNHLGWADATEFTGKNQLICTSPSLPCYAENSVSEYLGAFETELISDV